MTGNESQTTQPTRDVTRERIDDWRRRLIDLSYRNRLIRYRPTQATTIEIAAPSLETLLGDPDRTLPWRFYLPPQPVAHGAVGPVHGGPTLVDERVVRATQTAARPPEPDEIVAANEENPKRISRILE